MGIEPMTRQLGRSLASRSDAELRRSRALGVRLRGLLAVSSVKAHRQKAA